MILQVLNQSSIRLPRSYWDQKVSKAIMLLQRKGYLLQSQKSLTLVFLNPPAAKKINFQFRKKNYPTDVLSFESMDPQSFGELILCPQVLKKQALEHGLSFRDEGLYMIIHGILHLLGMDHERSAREAKQMLTLQDEIFARLLQK